MHRDRVLPRRKRSPTCRRQHRGAEMGTTEKGTERITSLTSHRRRPNLALQRTSATRAVSGSVDVTGMWPGPLSFLLGRERRLEDRGHTRGSTQLFGFLAGRRHISSVGRVRRLGARHAGGVSAWRCAAMIHPGRGAVAGAGVIEAWGRKGDREEGYCWQVDASPDCGGTTAFRVTLSAQIPQQVSWIESRRSPARQGASLATRAASALMKATSRNGSAPASRKRMSPRASTRIVACRGRSSNSS